MRKNTFIILAVVAALAVAVFVVKRKPPERGITRLELAQIDPKDVDHITVSGPQPIELVKKDTWVLAASIFGIQKNRQIERVHARSATLK